MHYPPIQYLHKSLEGTGLASSGSGLHHPTTYYTSEVAPTSYAHHGGSSLLCAIATVLPPETLCGTEDTGLEITWLAYSYRA